MGARVYLPVIPSIMIRAQKWSLSNVPEMNGARAGFCCRSGAVGAMKTVEVNGARAVFCCQSGAVGAMKTA